MKNFTFFILLALMAIRGHGQCTGTYQFMTVASNNSGLPQTLATCAYTTSDFIALSNISLGGDYLFTCKAGITDKYITVTDVNNTTIAHGPSPLTVIGINAATVRLHLKDNASCAGSTSCHTVTAQAILSCPVPLSATVTGLTTSNASFTWQPGGDESTWEVVVLPATSPVPGHDFTEGVASVEGDAEFSTTTLLPSMTYRFYYRAVCSSTEKSPWNISQLFTTFCDPVVFFSENFDASPAFPSCWRKIGTQGYAYLQSVSMAPSAPNAIYFLGSSTERPVLGMPHVANFDAGTHRIRFKMAAVSTVGGTIEFGFLTDPSDAASFVLLDSFSASSTTFEEYSYEPGSAPESGNLAFRHTGAPANSVYLDDIIWESIPACSDISQLDVQDVTSESAVVSWNTDGDETAWELAYGISTVTDPNTLTPVPADENSITVSGLEDNATYKLWVRSDCGNGAVGAWIGPKIFKTTCTPVASFNEGFDTATLYALPVCWIKVGSAGTAYVQASSSSASAPNNLYMSSYTGNAPTVALPPVSNISAGTHRLKFKAKSAFAIGGKIEVGYLTNTGDPETFQALSSFETTSTSDYSSFTYQPGSGEIEQGFLALRHTDSPANAVYIDDIVWEEAPSCGDVTLVAVEDISNNAATVTWTPDSETSWEVAYGVSSVTDPNTLTAVQVSSDPTIALSDLASSTTYKAWIRSNCGNGAFGAWIGPLLFNTSCDPVTEFTQNFDATTSFPSCWSKVGYSGLAYISTLSGAASAPNVLTMSSYFENLAVVAMQPVSNVAAGTHRLVFKAKSALMGEGRIIEVGYLASFNDASSFVAIQSFTTSSTTEYDTFYAEIVDDAATGYLAFRHSDNPSNAVYIDDVSWEAIPSCPDVSGLGNDEVTTISASVSWTPGGDEENWQIVYGAASFTDPTTLTPVSTLGVESYMISDLQPDTAYKYWVRSDCGNGAYGAWIGPKTFRTDCNPIASSELPWTEDFEDIVTLGTDFPSCWTKQNGDWQTSGVTIYNNAHSGTKYLRNAYNAVNEYMWTPGFALEANVSYDFSTFIQGDGYENWTVDMFYNNSPASADAIQLGETYAVPGSGNITAIQPYLEMRQSFIPSASGIYYFAVRVNEVSENVYPWYLAFDDFRLELTEDLSTPDFGINTLKSYPNPVKDILNLSYTDNISNVAVFNLLGQKIIDRAINANSTAIDMSSLPSGGYIVRITSDSQTRSIKIIKE